jgi:hypothetical protein
MNRKPGFIALKDLEVYQLSRQLSAIAWVIYERLTYQQRKVWGDQMLTAVDSVGSNIAASISLSGKDQILLYRQRIFIRGCGALVGLGVVQKDCLRSRTCRSM